MIRRAPISPLFPYTTLFRSVVVVRLDRMARSVRDLLNILERFGQDDIGFQSLREKHIDTTSAGGRLVLNIMASDRKSTRVNSSHVKTSYAIFCLNKRMRIGR